MAILFDFNGTMVYDERFNKAAWRSFLEACIHRPVTDQDFCDYIDGRNVAFTLEHFLQKTFSKEELAILEDGKESIYRRLCAESGEFVLAPGLEDFLNYLKEHKIPMTIVTAACLKNVQFFFEALGLEKWFDFDKVVYNDGSCKGKPEPDMYLKAAANLKAPIADCHIFEDSKAGLIAARRAGAKTVIRVLSMQYKEEGIDSDLEINTYHDLKYDAFL